MNFPDRTIIMSQPRTLVFGTGCLAQCRSDLAARGYQRPFIVTSSVTRGLCEPLFTSELAGYEARLWDRVNAEPTVADFDAALAAATGAKADVVIGLGGGSAMDVAKLVAAFLGSSQKIGETFGIGKLLGRKTPMICIPTTAGTGSEVSPNAILLDEKENLKKGVISPHLMPDAAYIDPALTLSVPASVTAFTGIDALTHCVEAYANKLAHPYLDTLAIEGVRLIAANLEKCITDPKNIDARSAVALGSLYGGLCLGPVNTGAVHALAYPLGGEFHVAHGLSNSLLLPHVLEFNLPAAPAKYAKIAVAMGAKHDGNDESTALKGLELIKDLSKRCRVPGKLREINIPQDAIQRMAKAAMTVTRLLDRNVRTVTEADAIAIYTSAY